LRSKRDLTEEDTDEAKNSITPAKRWTSMNKCVGSVDNWVTIFKFIIVILAGVCYFMQTLGYWHKWDSTCRNDWALHYYKCMKQSEKCYSLLTNDDAKIFYCTKKD